MDLSKKRRLPNKVVEVGHGSGHCECEEGIQRMSLSLPEETSSGLELQELGIVNCKGAGKLKLEGGRWENGKKGWRFIRMG
jgi:5-keto 4-deoxyuronate isomerase